MYFLTNKTWLGFINVCYLYLDACMRCYKVLIINPLRIYDAIGFWKHSHEVKMWLKIEVLSDTNGMGNEYQKSEYGL